MKVANSPRLWPTKKRHELSACADRTQTILGVLGFESLECRIQEQFLWTNGNSPLPPCQAANAESPAATLIIIHDVSEHGQKESRNGQLSEIIAATENSHEDHKY